MRVLPVTLVGPHLRMEPTTPAHFPGLFAAADADTFTFFLTRPASWTQPAFDTWMSKGLADTGRICFTMLTREGVVVGSSSYLDIQPAHRNLEIGSTWIAPSHRSTLTNPQAKLLMLAHAFDTLGCVRVTLKTDGRNLRSQAAIAKLGAVREGTLRRHRILDDGFVRDTVFFSITDQEWPEVRARLEHRLAKGLASPA